MTSPTTKRERKHRNDDVEEFLSIEIYCFRFFASEARKCRDGVEARERSQKPNRDPEASITILLLLLVVLNAFDAIAGPYILSVCIIALVALPLSSLRLSRDPRVSLSLWVYVCSETTLNRYIMFHCAVTIRFTCEWSGAFLLPFPWRLWRRQQNQERGNIFVLFYVGLDCVPSLNVLVPILFYRLS